MQAFFPFRLVGGGIDFAVRQVQVVAVVVIDEAVHQERNEAHAEIFDRTAQRHFVGFAVAVRVLRFERFEHFFEIVRRFRHLEAELFSHSYSATFCSGRNSGSIGYSDQAVDVAVRRRVKRLQFRVGIHRRLDIRRILVDQIIQRKHDALFAVFEQIGLGELVDVSRQHVSVRIVAARKGDLAFSLAPSEGMISNLISLNLLFQMFRENVGRQIMSFLVGQIR